MKIVSYIKYVKYIKIGACIASYIAIILISTPKLALSYGTTGAQILNLQSSAKISALGNANAGLANDLNALTYNPAGLTQLTGTEIQFAKLIYFMNTGMNTAALAGKISSIGLGIQMKLFDAEDTYRDAMGYKEKNFAIKYAQYTIGASYPLKQKHSIGLSANIILQNYNLSSISEFGEDKSSSATGWDIGWLYKESDRNSFGIVIKNIGGNFTLDNAENKLPLKYIFGSAHIRNNFLFVWDVFTGIDVNFGMHCGIQTNLYGFMPRCGITYIEDLTLALGFGMPYKNWSINYAFTPHKHLGTAHRISLGAKFK